MWEDVGSILLASTIPIAVWMSALTISAFVIFCVVFLVGFWFGSTNLAPI